MNDTPLPAPTPPPAAPADPYRPDDRNDPVRPTADRRPLTVSRQPLGLLLVIAVLGALIGGTIGGAVGASLAVRNPGALSGGPFSSQPTSGRLASGQPEARGVADVVGAVGPSVVTVVQKSASRQLTGGTGSGFIIDAERGYIATNSHVVSTRSGAAAPALDVILSDGRTVEARLVGRDPETDVAVLQIETRGLGLRAAVLGNSDEVPVGAAVVAIGSALGEFTNSVTSGVLSGKGRRFESDRERGLFLEDLVQTDAAISPGNSGGPLIWASTNQVIGMNTLVLRSPASEGLGFAVSSNTVRQIAEELIRSGRVERGRVGIGYQQLTPRAAMGLGLPASTAGIVITQVQAGSPGAQAGLRESDVVTKVNDQVLDAQHPLATVMLRFRPGDRVRLTVLRAGAEQVIEVTLGR